jgi:hypothetical protein
MGAKVLVVREEENDRAVPADFRKSTSAADIMESMVATEAELEALRAETDQAAAPGCTSRKESA